MIFTYNDEQRQIALEKIKQVDASKVFKNPIVTQVMTAPDYYSAETYHQDYLIKNPNGYMCHILRD